MNILFTHNGNPDISRTAEISFSNTYKDHQFRSAGIYKHLCDPIGLPFINEPLLKWADYIVCFDEKEEIWILRMFSKNFQSKIKVIHFNSEGLDYLSEALIFKLEEACAELSL